MKTNQAGIDLIKEFEGCKLEAYPDPATGGEPWTIGYGHTSNAGTPKVFKGLTITEDDAVDILRHDLEKFEHEVERVLVLKATGNQFAAMVSFCYNVGPGNFKSSSVLKRFNEGKLAEAADAFLKWNKAAGKVMKGLTRRREAEKVLFLTKEK
jgi:lysozyme